MPTFQYDDLPRWWYSLCETLSERADSVIQPPSGPFVIEDTASVVDGTVTVTIDRGGTLYTFECPAPDNTAVALRLVAAEKDWRRILIPARFTEFGGSQDAYPGHYYHTQTQQGIQQAIWGQPFAAGGMSFVINPGYAGPVLLAQCQCYFQDPVGQQFPFSGYSMVPVWTSYVDLGGFTMAQSGDREDIASALAFEPGGDVFNAEELAAIHYFAEKLQAAAQERSGQAANGRGDQLVKLLGHTTVLPPKRFTVESVLRRLAEAGRAAFSGGTVLTLPSKAFTRGSRAQVALNAGLLVLEDE